MLRISSKNLNLNKFLFLQKLENPFYYHTANRNDFFSTVPNLSKNQSTVLDTKTESKKTYLSKIRNLGISAHIDSGKTTLTERILYYTGRLKKIHEVRGKDGVGAKMDSMDLEREKGITIKSAATYATWKDKNLNIIDTPGHVDFTIEVERSMRVLDGAVLVLCGASGVQSQSITVNRQMNRYSVPRIAFVNKLDRQGADAIKTVEEMKKKLKLNAVLVQIPIGAESEFKGVVDLIKMKAIYFEGEFGTKVEEKEIPKGLIERAEFYRSKLFEEVADVDEELEEVFLEEKEPTSEQFYGAIRRATISMNLVPVLIGSAIKNKGVQPLLDAVLHFLPSPADLSYEALKKQKTSSTALSTDRKNKTEKLDTKTVKIDCDVNKPLLSYAFKLEESRYGQLTWLRVFQGTLGKGDYIYDVSSSKKKIKANRLVKMHSEEVMDVDKIKAGEIAALFGVECNSGTTFGSKSQEMLMASMQVPDPVISLAVQIKENKMAESFSKALKRFKREDPTFLTEVDEETRELLISGMGELHLDIYLQRLRREYGVQTKVSPPRVSFRERITQPTRFDYLHKKQTGGRGQFARVAGSLEPLGEEDEDFPLKFENRLKGLALPPNFVPSIRKGFMDFVKKGPLTGSPMQGIKFIVDGGLAHEVDSSELAFYTATIGAMRQALPNAGMVLFEPVMDVEILSPLQFQSSVVATLSRRNASIKEIKRLEESVILKSTVPLENMFGYSAVLRGCTEGKGEFSMEYFRHERVPYQKQAELSQRHSKEGGGIKNKF